MSPVGAMYTRDPHNTAPITLPSDKYPSSVMSTQIKNEENGLRTFVYSVGARAVVKHFFTCNKKHLQQYASELFKEFQISVKLEWQGAKTTLAAGTVIHSRLQYELDVISLVPRSLFHILSWQ